MSTCNCFRCWLWLLATPCHKIYSQSHSFHGSDRVCSPKRMIRSLNTRSRHAARIPKVLRCKQDINRITPDAIRVSSTRLCSRCTPSHVAATRNNNRLFSKIIQLVCYNWRNMRTARTDRASFFLYLRHMFSPVFTSYALNPGRNAWFWIITAKMRSLSRDAVLLYTSTCTPRTVRAVFIVAVT